MIAFADERAAELAGASLGQLRRWERLQLVVPSVRRELSPRNTVRLYGFGDMEALLVVTQLLNQKMSLPHIMKVVDRLRRDEGYDSPLNELRFAVKGGEIYFQRPDGTWSGESRPTQFVIHQVLDLAIIRATIREAAAAARGRDLAGRVERRRRVLASRPVFAGTRIPVDSVVEYIDRGADDATILEAFPRLTEDDVARARKQAAAAS